MEVKALDEYCSSALAAKDCGVDSIPMDWRPLSVKEIAAARANAIVGGPFGSDLVSRDYVAIGVPVIRGQNMARHYISGEFAFVSEEKAKQLQANTARAGDLIFTQRGTLGQIALVPTGSFDEYIVSQSQMKLTLNPRVACTEYVYQYFVSPWGQKQVIDSAIQTGVPHTNLGILQNYEIPFPPTLNEQQAIAEVLSDADALIESLSLLLAKKRQIKQGVMQELLTGKRRLPGFSSDWRPTELAQVGQWIGGMTPAMSNAAYWSPAEVPWLSSGDIKAAQLLNSAASVSSHAVKSGATKMAAEGSVVVVMRSGILRKFSPVALITRPMAINQDLKALLPDKDVSSEFLLHTLTYEGPHILATCLKSGTTVESIEFRWLKRTEIELPPLDEQRAIAQVLSDMDTEIDMVESRIAKARDLKQGMMQELLTGRIRLVQSASNVIPLPSKTTEAKTSSPRSVRNWQINEAVVISVLTQRFGTEKFPLPRKRRVKLMYLLHRHTEGRADGYLKKAAGPYDPNTKYKGPEAIALKSGYVRAFNNGKYEGFIAGANAGQACGYFEQWYGTAALEWLERFHYRKTDDLELLTTVDMAMVDIAAAGQPAGVAGVKRVIAAHTEWIPKLSRALFSDDQIASAIAECHALFGD